MKLCAPHRMCRFNIYIFMKYALINKCEQKHGEVSDLHYNIHPNITCHFTWVLEVDVDNRNISVILHTGYKRNQYFN